MALAIAVPFRFGGAVPPSTRPGAGTPGFVEAPPPPPQPGVGVVPVTGGTVSGVCGPGSYWDANIQSCVPVNPQPQCADGFIWSTTQQTCVPIGGPTQSGGSVTIPGSTESGGGEGPITVNVNNAVTVADQSANTAIRSVAGAVQTAINTAANTANTIAENTATTIGNNLNALTSTLDSQIVDAQRGIADVVSGITQDVGQTLGGIGNVIGNDIFNAINPVSVGLGQIITVISNQIGGLAGAIGSAVGNVIPLIIGAISGAINPVSAVLGTISGEIQQSIGQLTQLGSDVSGGFGSLDATLGRILTNWETYNTGFVEAQTGYPDGGSLHHDLSAMADSLAGLVARVVDVSPKLADRLSTICAGVDLKAELEKPVWDKSQPLWAMVPDFHKIAADLIIWIFSVFPTVQKITQETRQRLDKSCPQDLLTPATLVDAWVRGYLTEQQAKDEAAMGNLGASRMDLLRDLATRQLSAAELVEGLFRGVISATDYATALGQQGFTGGQQEFLRAIAVNLLNTNELANLVRRGTIGSDGQDAALKALHYDDAQRKALQSLTFRPPSMSEAIGGDAAAGALEGLQSGLAGVLQNVPEFVSVAAASEGLNVDATQYRWYEHWETGSINAWVDLYFRGQATFSQLQAVLRRAFIPDQLHTAIVAASRPLIQFRTISRMVFLKLLSPEQGKAQLLKHGYSDSDADTLIQYALVSGKAPAANVAKVQHGVSVGIAKQEYVDGSISAAQFYDVLVAHQFTPQGAETEIALIDAHEAMIRRKEQAQLIVDEYGAGLISETVALAQLAASGLTPAELAKYAHKIRAFHVKNAKLPTEAELKKMLKNGLISDDVYKQTLSRSGYPDIFVNAFFALDNPAHSVTGSAGTSSPPSP